MINVIIWDNDKDFVNQVKKILDYSVEHDKISSKIKLATTDIEKIVQYTERTKDAIRDINLYILESELKGKERKKSTGMDIARQIRKLDPLSYIVFASSTEKSLLESYDYLIKASAFFIKPVGSKELRTLIQEIISEHELMIERLYNVSYGSIALTSSYKTIVLNLTDIIAIEYKKPKVIIHTISGTCDIYSTMKNIYEKLKNVDGKGTIVRVHNAFIINTLNLESIDFSNATISMRGNLKVPISRARKRELKELYANDKLENKFTKKVLAIDKK